MTTAKVTLTKSQIVPVERYTQSIAYKATGEDFGQITVEVSLSRIEFGAEPFGQLHIGNSGVGFLDHRGGKLNRALEGVDLFLHPQTLPDEIAKLIKEIQSVKSRGEERAVLFDLMMAGEKYGVEVE